METLNGFQMWDRVKVKRSRSGAEGYISWILDQQDAPGGVAITPGLDAGIQYWNVSNLTRVSRIPVRGSKAAQTYHVGEFTFEWLLNEQMYQARAGNYRLRVYSAVDGIRWDVLNISTGSTPARSVILYSQRKNYGDLVENKCLEEAMRAAVANYRMYTEKKARKKAAK